MPGAPGSSLACKECRRRRKQCDLQQPYCLRCQNSDLICSGPKKHSTFIHAHVDGGKLRKQRQTLVDNIRNGRYHGANTDQLLKDARTQNDIFFAALAKNIGRSGLATNFSLGNTTFAPLFDAVIDEFKDGREVGIFSGDRIPLTSPREPRLYSSIAVSIRALLKLNSQYRDPLSVPLFALLVLYLGRLKGDLQMLELSRRAYGYTLDEVGKSISKLALAAGASLPRWRLLVCQTMILRLYELLDHVEPEHPNALAHEAAIASIVKTAGPVLFVHKHLQQLLQGLKSLTISNAIAAGRPTIFAEPWWTQPVGDPETRTPKQELIDVASTIPQIIGQADQLRQEFDVKASLERNVCAKAFSLLDQIAKLQMLFEAWLVRFDSLYDGPLFWNSSKPTYTGVSHYDSECQPRRDPLQHQLCFHSGPVAGILATHWSFRLKLWMIAANIHRGLCTLYPASEVKAMHKFVVDSPVDYDFASKTALMILEAMPYLSSCFEGNIVLQAPLKIVEEFQEQSDFTLRRSGK